MKAFKIILSILVILSLQLLFTHTERLNATPIKETTNSEMIANIIKEISSKKDLQALYDKIRIKALYIKSCRIEREGLNEEYEKLKRKETQLRRDQPVIERLIGSQYISNKDRVEIYYKQFDDIATRFAEIEKRKFEIKTEIEIYQKDLNQIEGVFKQIAKSNHIDNFLKSNRQYWMN